MWENLYDILRWEDLLPYGQKKDIVGFFLSLYEIENLRCRRTIWLVEEVDGDSMVIVFSDGDQIRYVAIAYIIWKLLAGGI